MESVIDPARAAELLKAAEEAPSPRFVRVKFTDRANSKEYTYRVELDAQISPGQYAITRKNLSKVLVIAIDCEPVPNLDLSRYDFVDPVPEEKDFGYAGDEDFGVE